MRIFKYKISYSNYMNELTSYIETCRKKGFSDKYIKKVLKNAGHQDFIIQRAFSMSKRKKEKPISSRNFLYSILILLGISAIMSLIFLINQTSGHSTTGKFINPNPFNENVSNNNINVLKTKNLIIKQQIEMINKLDLTLDEKNKLIEEQTNKINELFESSKLEKQELVNASLELINSILNDH